MLLFLLLVPAVVALIGLLLVWAGLRGRRLDDHPVCRRCRFDLHGLPRDSKVCSECGADLLRPRSIRLGNRARRPLLVATGAALILLPLIATGGASYARSRHVNWTPYKPTWWLTREMFGADSAAGDLASLEMVKRLEKGKLSTSQIDRVANRILDAQANTSEPWSSFWGYWMEVARSGGHISDAQWQRYEGQAMRLVLKVPATVRRGESVTYYLRDEPARIGGRTRLVFVADRTQLDLNGVPLATNEKRQVYFVLSPPPPPFVVESVGIQFIRGRRELSPKHLDLLSAGPQVLHASMSGTVYEEVRDPPAQFGPVRAHVNVEATATFTLLPGAQQDRAAQTGRPDAVSPSEARR